MTILQALKQCSNNLQTDSVKGNGTQTGIISLNGIVSLFDKGYGLEDSHCDLIEKFGSYAAIPVKGSESQSENTPEDNQ